MENTARNFALQLGSLITLYVSITSLIVLLWGIITVQYPDPADGYWVYESAASSIRFSIAVLIVFFPAYILLTRMVNTVRRREEGVYLGLTKWLIYLSLVIGGGVLLGDVVSVIYTFLEGEMVTRFLLKAFSMFLVIGLAFVYYVLDARGYWQTHEKQSKQYGLIASVVVVIALVVGFMHTETPAVAHDMRIDEEQINDLVSIEWRVAEYYELEGSLPETLDEVYVNTDLMPTAPKEREPYAYNKLTDTSFELCAEFAEPSQQSDIEALRPVMYEKGTIINPDNWDHDAGIVCFERRVQPVSAR